MIAEGTAYKHAVYAVYIGSVSKKKSTLTSVTCNCRSASIVWLNSLQETSKERERARERERERERDSNLHLHVSFT